MCVFVRMYVCVCVCVWVGGCVHACTSMCVCVCVVLLTSPLAPYPSSPAHQSLDGCLGVALCEEAGEQRRAELSPGQALVLV